MYKNPYIRGSEKRQYMKEVICVGFKDLTWDEIEEIVSGLGLKIRFKFNMEPFKNCTIRVPFGSEEDWVIKFQEMPEVRFAELEIIERIGPRG